MTASADSLVPVFDHTVTDYHRAGILPRIIAERLIDRLEDLHNFKPNKILDLGCGTGCCLALLHTRYPSAHIIGIDWSYPVLLKAKTTIQANLMQIDYVQGDIQLLPFKPRSFDLICANLSLLWINDLPHLMDQLKKHLKSGGLLLFTGFGIDTFKELPHITSSYPWGFSDMHTLGDLLATARWQDIVIDVDRFLTHYTNIQAFHQELQQLGLHTLLSETSVAHEENRGSSTAECSMTWEIIYSQAWHVERSSWLTETGEVSIPIGHDFKESLRLKQSND
jgi:malonyl-CoA O-methyltransferase